ncbi:MAG: radical SAM protein [Rickettsiales bacterium]|nr:radical SAM protein [Rickettsiales bacterium]
MIAGSPLERGLFYLNAKIGRFIPWKIRNYGAKLLYPHGKAKPRILTVDLSGSCNLRCPSCPVGSIGQLHPSGLMHSDLFRQIVQKARREHGMRIVALHNWTEPFLHPQLPEFIRIVKEEGLVCAISSNLTIARHIEEVLQAGPDFFRISLSGFTQESYATTHVRGDIEQVKQNMRLLSEARARTRKNRTHVAVFYHKYQHNLEEMKDMRAYTKALGFAWEESWAYYMSLEKIFQLMEGKLTDADKDFVQNRLALPIPEAIAAAKALKGQSRCTLLEDQIVLDYRGNVSLCCAVYDQAKNGLGNFMEMSADALKEKKTGHPTCKSCAGSNLHLYFTYHDIPELNKTYQKLAQARLHGLT